MLEQLAVIRLAQSAGFTIAETRTVLHGFAPDTPPPERWRELAARKLPAVDAQIARLQGMRAILEAGLRCECLALAECAHLLGAEREASAGAGWTG